MGQSTTGSVDHVGVVGGGLMGAGIAEACARAGIAVTVVEVDDARVEGARARITGSMDKAVRGGKLTDQERDVAWARIDFAVNLKSLANCDLVIEAIAEDAALKTALFRDLDAIVENRDAVLASNTSSIPIIKLATATTRPHRVVGLHFFQPVPVTGLVEVVPSLLTADDTVGFARQFATDTLAKTVIVAPDRAGFVVNALLLPYLLSAVRMVESGVVGVEDLDVAMKLGCGYPMGPLQLLDFIGIDTAIAVAETLYAEFREQAYAPPPLLMRMAAAGRLGKKTGHGFYDYGASRGAHDRRDS